MANEGAGMAGNDIALLRKFLLKAASTPTTNARTSVSTIRSSKSWTRRLRARQQAGVDLPYDQPKPPRDLCRSSRPGQPGGRVRRLAEFAALRPDLHARSLRDAAGPRRRERR